MTISTLETRNSTTLFLYLLILLASFRSLHSLIQLGEVAGSFHKEFTICKCKMLRESYVSKMQRDL